MSLRGHILGMPRVKVCPKKKKKKMSISLVDTDTLERLRKAHLAGDHFAAVLGGMKNEAVSAGSEHFGRERHAHA